MDVHAPQPGRVVQLGDVPDPVFATAMVGPGIALHPSSTGPVVATCPVAGTLVVAKPHAFVVQGVAGALLVHLGIDTVGLRGRGFEILASVGEELRVGDPVVRWDPVAVVGTGLSPLVIVIAMGAAIGDLDLRADGDVTEGDLLFVWRG